MTGTAVHSLSASAGSESAERPAHGRVVLKLSGEMFGGGRVGVDPNVVHQMAQQIAAAIDRGAQVAIVVG
ncbi:MAG: UMP kinase, partial [Micromonosporaceae bacterium]